MMKKLKAAWKFVANKQFLSGGAIGLVAGAFGLPVAKFLFRLLAAS